MLQVSGRIIVGPPIFHGRIDLVDSVDNFLQCQVCHENSPDSLTLHGDSLNRNTVNSVEPEIPLQIENRRARQRHLTQQRRRNSSQ
jgi:hypothetical protein